MTLSQGVSFALQFTSSVVLARYLTPYEMGISAVAFSVVGLLLVIQHIGLPAFIVRAEQLTDEVTATAFTVNAAVCVLLSGLIAAISVAGAAFLESPGVQQVLLVLAITPLFGVFSFLPGARLERDGRFKSIAMIATAGGIVGAVATIGFVVSGFSYMSVAYASVLSSAVLSLLVISSGRRYMSLRVGVANWRDVASFAVQMLAVSGVTSLAQRLSEIALARLLGLASLGVFNRAVSMNGLLWNNIHAVVGRVVLVDYADLHRSGVSLRDRYLRTVAITTAFLWPSFAGLAVIAKPLVIYIYGEQWAPAVTPFALLSIASILLVSVTMTWELFTATGRLWLQTRIETARAFFSLITFVGGCFISLEAAAAARIVDAFVAFVMYRKHINSMTDTVNADYWPIYKRSFAATLVAIAPASCLMLLSGANGPGLVALGAAILSGALLWFVYLKRIRHPIAEEIETTAAYRYCFGNARSPA